MGNEKLKDCLDDALSGIGESPWLLRQVLARAESGENTPVKKKISFGTVVIALLILALMSAGIAAVSRWNVLDFLGEWGRLPSITPAEIAREAETENAALRVESAVYDGGTLAFDWTIENRHPEVPLWICVEEFSVNGKNFEAGILDDGYVCSCQYEWLPGMNYESVAQCGELVHLTYDTAGQETARVVLRVKACRPVRPVAMMQSGNGINREELERKIAEGYYVIPCMSWNDDGSDLKPDGGFFVPEEDPDICPSGWAVAVSDCPPEDVMGGVTAETLEIRFDVAKQEQMAAEPLQTQSLTYENRYCSAVYEQADLSPLGLYLTLRMTPKSDGCRPVGSCRLTDGEGNPLPGITVIPVEKDEFLSPDNGKDLVWKYRWNITRMEYLPDTISMTCRLENGEDLVFPIRVRHTEPE